MTYSCSISVVLGSSKVGLTLVAQLINTEGVNTGDPITTGFVEIGQGNYLWSYNDFPYSFRGGIKFYNQADPSKILAFTAMNPEDVAYVNKLEEVIQSPSPQVEIKTPTLVSSHNTEVAQGEVKGNPVRVTIKSGPSTSSKSVSITTGTD